MASNLERLVKNLGFEARRNAPFGLMVLALVFIIILGPIDFHFQALEFAKYTLALAIFASGAVAAVVDYLQRPKIRAMEVDETRLDNLSSELSSLKTELDTALGKLINHTLSHGDAEALKHQISHFVENRAVAALSKELQSKLSVDNTKRFHLGQIRAINDGMINRLSTEIASLGYRANFNLAIGAVVCVVGLGILFFYVFFEPHTYTGGPQVFIEMTTRLSLVVFIEVFAFFFLNLYRYGLFEIKYFQNEITNANFRSMALETALVKGDTATLKKICEEMAQTERNFILKKSETTLDLRRAELYMQNERSLSKWYEKIISILSKAKGATPENE